MTQSHLRITLLCRPIFFNRRKSLYYTIFIEVCFSFSVFLGFFCFMLRFGYGVVEL